MTLNLVRSNVIEAVRKSIEDIPRDESRSGSASASGVADMISECRSKLAKLFGAPASKFEIERKQEGALMTINRTKAIEDLSKIEVQGVSVSLNASRPKL